MGLCPVVISAAAKETAAADWAVVTAVARARVWPATVAARERAAADWVAVSAAAMAVAAAG